MKKLIIAIVAFILVLTLYHFYSVNKHGYKMTYEELEEAYEALQEKYSSLYNAAEDAGGYLYEASCYFDKIDNVSKSTAEDDVNTAMDTLYSGLNGTY